MRCPRYRAQVGAFALMAALLGATACTTTPSSDSGQTSSTTAEVTSVDSSDVTTTDSSGTTTADDDSSTDGQDTASSFEGGSDLDIALSNCDPVVQDCVEGEKCVPYADPGPGWDTTTCVLVTGVGEVGESCTSDGPEAGSDDCGEDSVCWNIQDVDGTLTGTCAAFCTGGFDDPQCDPGTACMLVSDVSVFNLCVQSCDPLAQDPCPAGQACAWISEIFGCNVPLADGQQGEPCGLAPTDCSPGLQCVPGENVPGCAGESCCTSICAVKAAPDPCVDLGLACRTLFENATPPPGFEDVGYCGSPP